MTRVLLVEDDRDIAAGIVYSLEVEGYTVDHSENCARAYEALAAQRFDLLLIDLGLPDGSGHDVMRFARKDSAVPVIFLTARDDEANIVMGLDMGADDYITKPFRVRELMSRIASVLRRSGQAAVEELAFGPLVIRPGRAQVLIHGEEVLLTAMEYRLLLNFAARPGQLFSRSQLLETLWDVDEAYVNDNTLSVYIKRLREKLAPAAPAVEVVTVRGLGYRLNTDGDKNN
ncbi:MAG: response regulator transcription factor [Ruminococcaceae bacterium]|nr:response regulator transcription factor [Oscillospiraceae bacterium]